MNGLIEMIAVMIGGRGIDYGLFEDLKTFEFASPDPSEFFTSSENATMSKLMMGNQNAKLMFLHKNIGKRLDKVC